MRKGAKIRAGNFQPLYSLQMSTNHDFLRVTYVRGLLWKKLETFLAKSYFDPGMPEKFIFEPPCVAADKTNKQLK